jgi:hypothetical protein
MTFHDKTNLIALTTDFELMPPLPTTTFELASANLKSLARVVLEIYTRIARTKVLQKIDHCYVRCPRKSVLAVYAKYVAKPTKSNA